MNCFRYIFAFTIVLILAGISSQSSGGSSKDSTKKFVSDSKEAAKISTPKPSPSSPAAKKAPNSKIQLFLQTVQRAQNLKEVEKAFKRGNFNQAEIKQLEREIENSSYEEKLQALKQADFQRVRTGKQKTSKKAKPNLNQMKAHVKQVHSLKVSRLNQEASTHLAHGSSRHVAARASLTAGAATRATMQALASIEDLRPSSPVNFSSFSPVGGIIGQTLSIRGSGFGSVEGQVIIGVGRPGESNSGAFFCPVRGWSNSLIEVTIPLDFEEIITFRESRFGISGSELARICITPGNSELGACHDLEIQLDRERFAPEITSISSSEITPGQRLIIRGNNFKVGEIRPHVSFYFGRERFEGLDPDSYDHDYIEVHLDPEIEGMFSTAGRVEVWNPTALTDFREITFIPEDEIIEMISDEMRARCQPSRPRFLCLIGDKRRFTIHDLTLTNGWVVEDSWLETSTRGPNSGAYYVHEPTPGSDRAKSVIEVWADAYASATAIEYLYLKGPKGTFDRSH